MHHECGVPEVQEASLYLLKADRLAFDRSAPAPPNKPLIRSEPVKAAAPPGHNNISDGLGEGGGDPEDGFYR